MIIKGKWTEPLVLRLIERHGGRPPEAILEALAEKHLTAGGQHDLPVDVEGIASLLGIRRRIGDHPFAGRIYAEENGQLVMDLNASDSEPRRRFSCAHEIMHTAFPGFRNESRYRADPVVATYNRARGEEEYLCDVGAAALIMPRSLVHLDYSISGGLEAVEQLASDAEVSLEAAGNRLTSLSHEPSVFLVFSWSCRLAISRPIFQESVRARWFSPACVCSMRSFKALRCTCPNTSQLMTAARAPEL